MDIVDANRKATAVNTTEHDHRGLGKMTAFGVGPRIALFSLPYLALMLVLHIGWPQVFLMTGTFHPVFVVVGSVVAATGIVLWARGARVIDHAFNEGILLTTGVYGIVRNPMYSGLILLLIPGVALALRSWPLLTVAIISYVIFRVLIKKEERYLEEKFGQAFLDYRARVNAIVPCPPKVLAVLR